MDVEYIDPERNLSRAKELFDKYKVVSDESLLVIDYEVQQNRESVRDGRRSIRAEWPWGKGPRVTAFKGEQAIRVRCWILVRGQEKHSRDMWLAQGATRFLKTAPSQC